MLTLYYKPTCIYSQDVLAEAEAMGLRFNLKDISTDETLANELIVQGGKKQVPFLIDTDHPSKLYESDAIIAHLRTHYTDAAPQSFGGLHIHQSGEICDSCQ